MAALSDYTSLSTVNDLIPATQIGKTVLGFNYAPTVAQLVAWMERLEAGQGSTFTFPRWDQTTVPAGAKAQSDTFAENSTDTSAEIVTPGYIGGTYPVSYEAMHDSSIGLRPAMIVEIVRALRDRYDADLLALATSCTNTQGSVLDVFNRAKMAAALASFKATVQPQPGDQVVAIVSPSASADLVLDEVVTAATARFGNYDVAALPIVGTFGSVVVLESSHIPANSTGYENIITLAGRGRSGLGMVVAEEIGVGVDISEQRKVAYITVAGRAGFGITAQRNLISVLAR